MSTRASRTLRQALIGLSIVLASSACSTRSLPDGAEACLDPRPQICTAIYDPVCAYRPATGMSPTTYASDCSACADPAVAGFVRGACIE